MDRSKFDKFPKNGFFLMDARSNLNGLTRFNVGCVSNRLVELFNNSCVPCGDYMSQFNSRFISDFISLSFKNTPHHEVTAISKQGIKTLE